APSEDVLPLIKALNPQSQMYVPLMVRNRVIGAIGFVITESNRRHAPAELAIVENLAGKAAVAIENARLYHELQTSDRRKDEFLAMLAHELRNPLAPIRNAVELLGRTTDPQLHQWAHEVIHRQVTHIVRLVDDLLDVSRIKQGKIHLQRQSTELSKAIHNAV